GLLAVRCPSFHQPSPFIQHIAPPIGPLRRVPNNVAQGGFRNFPREVRLLRAPVPKAGPEAVDRNAARNLSQHRSLPAFEDLIPASREPVEDLQGAQRERDSVLPVGLGPKGRHSPDSSVEINLRPTRLENLSGARGSQDGKLERPRREPVALAK